MGDRLNNPQFNVDAVTGQITDQNLVDANNLQIDMQRRQQALIAMELPIRLVRHSTIMRSKIQ